MDTKAFPVIDLAATGDNIRRLRMHDWKNSQTLD